MTVNTLLSCHFDLFQFASSLFEQSHSVIMEKLYEESITHFSFKNENKVNNIFELRFDNMHITLSCSFNESNLCDLSYLFFDSLNDVYAMINYLEATYIYDQMKGYWVLPNCNLIVEGSLEDTFIRLIKINNRS